jgi:hypothetical protein
MVVNKRPLYGFFTSFVNQFETLKIILSIFIEGYIFEKVKGLPDEVTNIDSIHSRVYF